MGTYSVYPTGTTIYDRDMAQNGYTVFHAFDGAIVIDMNGNTVHKWKGLNGSPSRLLPGGNMLGTINQPVIAARFEEDGQPELPDIDSEEMLEVTWEGEIVWRKRVAQHHDFQVAGNPVGYPVPGMPMDAPQGRRFVILQNIVKTSDRIPGIRFLDDRITEYDEQGNEIFTWDAFDHIDDFGLSEEGKQAVYHAPQDWCHLNAVSYIGPNRHFDAGNEIFDPENLILSSRELSLIFIVRKNDGKIVWKKGPAEEAEEVAKRRAAGKFEPGKDDVGLIIGQHHAHIIPEGLPGAGNLLVYDNGGFSGYDKSGLQYPDGRRTLLRHYSRVIEIDPVNWKKVWEYRYDELDITASGLFSPLLGCAQRLENGNTLITEGVFGRLMEVTPEKDVVWEFVNDRALPFKVMGTRNLIYRAYRVPYDYLPFVEKPEEISIPKVDVFSWRVPGSPARKSEEGMSVELK